MDHPLLFIRNILLEADNLCKAVSETGCDLVDDQCLKCPLRPSSLTDEKIQEVHAALNEVTKEMQLESLITSK